MRSFQYWRFETMKLRYVVVCVLSIFLSNNSFASDFSISFDWGNIKKCTSGKPNKVSNPIFELKTFPAALLGYILKWLIGMFLIIIMEVAG